MPSSFTPKQSLLVFLNAIFWLAIFLVPTSVYAAGRPISNACGTGSGSADEPFTLCNRAQLEAADFDASGQSEPRHFRLGSNINMGIPAWLPRVGKNVKFSGERWRLSNLHISESVIIKSAQLGVVHRSGFFSELANSEIRDLTIANATVGYTEAGPDGAGLVIGTLAADSENTNFTNITITALSIDVTSKFNYIRAGGLSANIVHTVKQGVIEDVTVTGSILGAAGVTASSSQVGGIASRIEGADVIGNSFHGNIVATKEAGGIVSDFGTNVGFNNGLIAAQKFERNRVYGSISVETGSNGIAGGLIGSTSGGIVMISNSFFGGSVSSSHIAAGVVGFVGGDQNALTNPDNYLLTINEAILEGTFEGGTSSEPLWGRIETHVGLPLSTIQTNYLRNTSSETDQTIAAVNIEKISSPFIPLG